MAKAPRYKCVMCGTVVRAKKPARTCSTKCRVAYHRHIQNGGEERPVNCLDGDLVTRNVTGKSSVTQTPPSDRQAVFEIPDGYELVAKPDLERYRVAFDIVLDQQLRSATDPQKKSDFGAATLPTFQRPIDPPVVMEESPEMKKKREDEARKRSIANTLAALDDF